MTNIDHTDIERWKMNHRTVLFLRHAERDSTAPNAMASHGASLTDLGLRQADAFGALLADCLGPMRSSPVPRCVDTARAILDGAQRASDVAHDRRLGDPSVFVTDGDTAMRELTRQGLYPVATRLGSGEQLPGFADPDRGTSQLVCLAMEFLKSSGDGVQVLVTHDLMIATMIARIRGGPLAETEWPGYLHGLEIWVDHDRLMSRYAGTNYVVSERFVAASPS